MSATKILEIACFNLESALIAEQAGADRIEFCVDYKNGGLSPSIAQLQEARNKIKIPMFVMVRPRAGNFVYSEMEIQWMIQYIMFCEIEGIDGIVFGALSTENKIDIKTCSRIIEAAGSLSLTFHRAIDECKDMKNSIDQLITIGVHRVLTSGGEKNALAGLENIKHLQLKFGNKIKILPGGGIRSSNINLLKATACTEFHSSALIENSSIADANEILRLKQFLTEA